MPKHGKEYLDARRQVDREREYTPHLTLGRLSQDDRAEEWGPTLAKYADWDGGSTPVDEVAIPR